MTRVAVIGDGPAGLSAALLLAKNNISVRVYGRDGTPMHKAMLYNYLGLEEMDGTDFQQLARKQVEGYGGEVVMAEVSALEPSEAGFAVRAGGSEQAHFNYVVLATGSAVKLGESVGAEKEGSALKADRDGKTSVPKLYAAGWSSRPQKNQAIISAGDGAAAALDILTAESGRPFRDFDVKKG